ncbi:MAG: DUF3307 domain-containing protein [Janthinobacterium lividum]
MHYYAVIFFWLVCGHFLCDYALQSQFIADAKNPFKGLPGIPWIWPMAAHCFIHGAVVAKITGSVFLGIVEIVLHFYCDFRKCWELSKREIYEPEGLFHVDQIVHILGKVIILIGLRMGL